MKYSCGFPFAAYIKEVLKPICTIVILSLVILYILIKINIINQTFIDILINSLLLEIYFFVIIWICGLNNDEKASFKSHLRINKTHSL